MKRRYNYFIVLFLLLCLAFGLTACKGCAGTENPVVTISLSQTELELEEYETATLTATVTGTTDEPKWESSDETVATVDNGVVTAMAAGTATITVSVGAEQASCNVTIHATSSVPVLTLSHKETTLRVGDSLNVSGTVTFNNKIRDVAISWNSENTTVASVEDGKILAVSIGETKIVATAFFAGRTMQSSLIVTVREDVEIEVNTTSIVLKNDALIDPDQVQFEIEYAAKVNNQPYQGDFVISVDDTSIVTENAGVITAKKAGETIVRVSIEVNEKTYSEQINVIVEKSQKTIVLEDGFETYSGIDGENRLLVNTLEVPLNGNTLLNDRVIIADDNDEKEATITLQDDAMQIDGSMLGSNIYGDVKISAETEIHKLVFYVKVVTKHIRTAEDFNALTVYGNMDESCDYDGLFELESDLVLPRFTYTKGGKQGTEQFWNVQRPVSDKIDGTSGFKGVFDGKGYQISFMDFGWHNATAYSDEFIEPTKRSVDHNGLFGNVASGAVIKNLGIDVDFHQRWDWVQGCVLAKCFAGTLENCSVRMYSSAKYAVHTGLARYVPNAKFIDCMLWLDLYNTRNSIADNGNGVYAETENYGTSYIAYIYEASKAPSFENMIVVINENQIYDAETQTWTERKANPFRGYALSDLGLEGITEYEYTDNFSLDNVKGIENFKTENKKYWRTVSREVATPQADGTWGNAQSFTHLTMAGGINPLWDEIGLEWSDKWTN